MTVPFFRAALLAGLLSTLPLVTHAGANSALPTREDRPSGRIPRPCLVTPVPPKGGLPPSVGGPFRMEIEKDTGRLRKMNVGEDGVTHLKVLVIRVDFEQDPMDSTEAYFERLLLFQHQYYDQVSDGQLQLDHTLLPTVYRMPHPLAYYGLDDSIGVREATLTWDAIQAADPDVDYRQYDRVLMFHSGPGQESDVKDDSREQIWSIFLRQLDFAYYLPFPGASRGIRTGDTWAPGDTVFVQSCAIFPESESQDGYVFGDIGVVCHEFGHALGLPDLYDTTAPVNHIFAESQGIGSWDIMSSGTWNGNGFIPAEFSAWSKIFLGWIEPRVVSSDQVVSLDAVETDRRHGIVKIPINDDEYFLVENRQQDVNGDGRFNYDEKDSTGCFYQKTGNDSSLICLFDLYKDSYAGAEWDYWLPGEGKGSGLLIWHIDQSVMDGNLEYNTVNADPSHKAIDLEEADGIQDMDTLAGDIDAFGSAYDAYRAGNADRFGPDTEPNSDAYYGIRTGITIDQVSASGPTMNFRVAFGSQGSAWTVATPAPIGSNHVGVADLDGDSQQEIVVTDRGGDIFVLNPDGTPAWSGGPGKAFKSLNTAIGSPLLADVDGDGRSDLLVMTDDGRVYGWKGGSGAALGKSADGPLLVVEHPAHGAELWACDLRPGEAGQEFVVGSGLIPDGAISRIGFYSVTGGDVLVRGTVTVSQGTGALPGALLEFPGDRHALVTSVRGGTPDKPKGSVVVGFGTTFSSSEVIAPLPDTALYSAPVTGDLNRDGNPDFVVTGSNGLIYAFTASPGGTDNFGVAVPPGIALLPGWPQPIFASGNDGVSLADVDGNGYLEVLALETGGVLHVFNYHGESLVSLPEQLPSETKYFVEPQLAPLVCDLTNDGKPELILPLSDGQVFAVRTDGTRASSGYFGGGSGGSSPAVADLDGNGTVELVTASSYLGGGRIELYEIGQSATPPAWGMYRRDGSRDGAAPAGGNAVQNGPFLTDSFVMPNPARDVAKVHYRVGADVNEVTVQIFDMTGRGVRSLPATSFPGTDNDVTWDLTGEDGKAVSPGVYLARIEARGAGASRLEILKFAVIK